jgi:hypothetical protein
MYYLKNPEVYFEAKVSLKPKLPFLTKLSFEVKVSSGA